MKKKIVAFAIGALITTGYTQQAYAYDFIYEDDVYTMCEEICKPYHISPELVQSIIYSESRYAKDAVNGNCKGLCQINEGSHKARMERLGVTDLYNPYDNIRVGVDYLSELFNEYEEASLVLDLYNGRKEALDTYTQGKQSGYAKKILDKAYDLEEEHGKHGRREDDTSDTFSSTEFDNNNICFGTGA